MTSKSFQIAFNISGAMSSGFSNTFASGSKQLRTLKSNIKSIQIEQKALDSAWNQGAISANTYSRAMSGISKRMEAAKLKQNALTVATNNYKNATRRFAAAKSSFFTTTMTVAAVTAPFLAAAKTAISFEAKMKRVKSITNATAGEFDKLSACAKEMGAKTRFTASQSAEAMTFLGMAGWKTNQIISGMPGLLNLAVVGETGLAQTSTIVADTLNAFGMKAAMSTHLADVFAVTITNTNTDVGKLGETMKYAAPIAKGFGVSLEETAAIAGLMANAGIKGSDAGTALRAGMLRLAGPPKMAAKAMAALGLSMTDITSEQKTAAMALKNLGISMSDGDGKTRKMSAIVRDLKNATKGMTHEQKIANLSAIFGQRAAGAWLGVIDKGPEELDKLTTALENSDGASAKFAEEQKKTARGAFIELKSAIEAVGLSLGSVLLPPLRDAAQGMASWARTSTAFLTKYPAVAKAISFAVIGVSALVIGYKTYCLVTAAAQAVTAGFNLVLTANPIGLVIAAVAALVIAGIWCYKNWNLVCKGMGSAWEWLKSASAVVFNWFVNVLNNLPQYAAYAVGAILGFLITMPDRTWAIFVKVVESGKKAGKQFVTDAGNWASEAIDSICSWFSNLPERVSGYISNTWSHVKSGFNAGLSIGVSQNAVGGFYNKGAFLTTFAEESPEAAIPINGTKRAKNLWYKTGEALGMGMGSIRASYAPTINIEGTPDNNTVDKINKVVRDGLADFDRRVRAWRSQKERVAYD